MWWEGSWGIKYQLVTIVIAAAARCMGRTPNQLKTKDLQTSNPAAAAELGGASGAHAPKAACLPLLKALGELAVLGTVECMRGMQRLE